MDPFSIAFGVANAGMGILGGISSYQAQKQDYRNQKAFQNANGRFAQWQAGFNARITDANAQYKYWADTINYNQQKAYTNSLRNFELIKSIRQAEVVEQTRAAAGAAFAQDSNAISQSYQEASMQEAVAMQQYRWRALQARASVQAMNQEGKSIDRIVNDYARQEGDYATLMEINQKLRTRQYNREQAGQVAQYLNRWNSQQFYEEQPYIDPIPPFAPLPTLLTPPPPSMTGSGPSAGAAALNIGTGILGGIQAGMSMQGQLNNLRTPSGPTGPGTPR
ncbi:MAG: uncultured phage MedDCM-OCT-S37-C6 [Cyanobacteriota bacterium]|jgi:hypothetical protein